MEDMIELKLLTSLSSYLIENASDSISKFGANCRNCAFSCDELYFYPATSPQTSSSITADVTTPPLEVEQLLLLLMIGV